MKIDGKVHCFFEQSGTFKNEFIKLGIPAEDYDIQNHFGQTDHVIDLFAQIEKSYNGDESIFDNITKDDLIMAFFPCIYFTGFTNPLFFCCKTIHLGNLSFKEMIDKVLQRADDRNMFYKLLYKFVAVVEMRGLRMIFENPWNTNGEHYLHNNFIKEPTIVDKNRTFRGDFFEKPTGFWFFGCEPTYGKSYQNNKEVFKITKCKSNKKAGICSEERSMISPDYARNFICDFILGKKQKYTQQTLFEL